MSRVVNSYKNISTGLFTQLVQMALGFVSRTIFVQYLAIEYLGVDGLFSSILGIISLAELGIGNALLYAMYKPLAERNEEHIAKLVRFFKKVYFTIAIVMILAGLSVVPFLSHIVKTPIKDISNNIEVIFLIFLFNNVVPYFFYHKVSLFNANQQGYLLAKRNIIIIIIQMIAQIIALILFKNYLVHIIIYLVAQLAGNLYLTVLVKRYFPYLDKYTDASIDVEEKKSIFSNIKSTAIVKLGGLLVYHSTNIITNHFSGLMLVGLLSNYYLLIGIATSFVTQVFSGLTASIANLNATENLDRKYEVFKIMNFLNFLFYGTSSLFLLFLVGDFIVLWVGHGFLLDKLVLYVLVLNFFMVGMQNAVWTYRTTMGIFKQGRYIVILTAVLNLGIGFTLGNQIGLIGILLSLTIARLLTNTWYDPYALFKYGFGRRIGRYFLKYLLYVLAIAVTCCIVIVLLPYLPVDKYLNLIFKFLLIFLVSQSVFFFFFHRTHEYKYLLNLLTGLKSRLR